MMFPGDTPMMSATISGCGEYRYTLHRAWDEAMTRCCFVMLNPSTADGLEDDPTIRRCVGFARSWGCGSLAVVHLFPLRSPNPAALKSHRDPVGPDNDRHIVEQAANSSVVVAAWGSHGTLRGRSAEVRSLLRSAGIPLRYLKLTGSGEPGHPLYLTASLTPTPF